MVELLENHIIVFDCEGLFSRQRKEIEEVKMITLLSAVCDFTYLNQDLSFSRHLNNLLNNLSNSMGRLKGGNLFKGKLIWTIRDVGDNDKEGAKREFMGQLNSFTKHEMSFMTSLFNGEITFTCLNNFQHNHFKKEIEACRKEVLKRKNTTDSDGKLEDRIRSSKINIA